ncbi:hypothetical protein ABZ471_38115 [Streptomyces sp. NPDC005728]|uniref:hypothetical protein n=1 Tax=Streptomyces sp. NPDC005728 TaxID=3157054 RepID=UPI0033F0BE7F
MPVATDAKFLRGKGRWSFGNLGFGLTKREAGPSRPNALAPGSAFSADLYRQIAEMPNDQFLAIRNKVMARDPADPLVQGLQHSFYSKGCVNVPDVEVTERMLNTCLQQDFRYTAGANVTGGLGTPEGQADKKAADDQFGKTMIGISGSDFTFAAANLADADYVVTPTTGDPLTSLSQVTGE